MFFLPFFLSTTFVLYPHRVKGSRFHKRNNGTIPSGSFSLAIFSFFCYGGRCFQSCSLDRLVWVDLSAAGQGEREGHGTRVQNIT